MTSATMADQVSAALRGTGGGLGARARTGASRTGGAGSRLAPPRGGGAGARSTGRGTATGRGSAGSGGAPRRSDWTGPAARAGPP